MHNHRIATLYSLYLRYPKIITDSRKAEKNSIFFALKGDNFDGNDFVTQALEAGCDYAVTDRIPPDPGDARYLVVDDVLVTLQALARMHREKTDVPVIAVTGTNGKTTTKELMKQVLSSSYQVHATPGNLNNHIGVPLTLLSVPTQAQIIIVEMGASHRGEIRDLCHIAQPTHGLITNVGKGHLEGFGGMDGVIRAKKELYEYLDDPGKIIFFNEENPVLTGMLEGNRAKTVAYGKSGHSLYWGKVISASPFLQIELHMGKNSYEISGNLAGAYNLENMTAAACIGNYFDVPPDEIAKALAGYAPQNNRSQVVETGHNKLLLDYYNANPTSMRDSLINFFDQISGPKTVILGDMFELGDFAGQEHAAIVEMLSEHPEITSYVVGEHFYREAKKYPAIHAYQTVDELKDSLAENLPEGHFILIKGSRAMKLEKLQDIL